MFIESYRCSRLISFASHQSPNIRLPSLGKNWTENFKAFSTSSTTESSSNCFRSIQFSDAEAKIVFDNKGVQLPPVNLFVFDLETSGLGPKRERITEFGIRYTQGGKNSCFQTLVNPEKDVLNSDIHGITTDMVTRRDVPMMKQLIPLIFRFIRSLQVPGGQVVLAAHNSRRFDVPFLKEEFRRCSFDIPHGWDFFDTVPMARQVMELYGPSASSNVKLQTLGEFYGIPSEGEAHRAMADVNLLTSVLANMISDLNFSSVDLLQRTFKASDMTKKSKKSKKKS